MTTVDAIERAAAIAWPAAETEQLGEWVLSFGSGFSRRRNSAVPSGPLPADPEQRIAKVVSRYLDQGVTPRFRVTSACEPEVDELLESAGFHLEAPTLVLTRPLGDARTTEGVVTSPTVSESWIAAELAALDVDRSLVDSWIETIRAVPRPAAFATALEGRGAAGAGLGVVVDGLLASFEIAVADQHRRRGHARRLMTALHTFGVSEGAGTAFLQVMESNRPAIALYDALRYETAYRYWYRVHGA